ACSLSTIGSVVQLRGYDGHHVHATGGDVDRMVERAAAGDQRAWSEILARHRARLRRMVALRLDRRLQGRVDPSDVLQEACLDAARRLPGYLRDRPMPVYLWLRVLAGQRVQEQHRRHLGAAARDAGREVSLQRGPLPGATTAALADHLLGRHTSPSQAAVRAERRVLLQEALNGLDPIDREVLALRHFEERSNGGAARVLGPDKSAASKQPAPPPPPP